MRTVLGCLMLVAACGGDDGAVTPHGPDAAVVDPGPLDGVWMLEWTCRGGCPANPGLFRFLNASGRTLTYSDNDGSGRFVRDVASATEGDCMDVPVGHVGALTRNPYRICVFDGVAVVSGMTWDNGATLIVYDMQGTR